MKQPTDTATPELQLDGQPLFDLDIERDCEWPMPEVKPWKPEPEAGAWEWFFRMGF